MPWGPTLIDGRCWACAQRRRWWGDRVALMDGDAPRHWMHEGRPICSLPSASPSRSPETRGERQKEYLARRKAKGLRADPAVARRARLKQYGLTTDDFDAMVARQENRCACCGVADPTDVDHNHETGEVRGIVCRLCNLMLGHAKDDPARLVAGIAYLNRNQPTPKEQT